MAASTPERLTLTFPDGSTTTVPFGDLPGPLRDDLLRQPGLRRDRDPLGEERFLLLEWEDGWKEVIAVDGGCTDLKRYYVITRTEDVGRLALEHESGYPELVEIARRPLGLRRISLDGTVELTPARTAREGGKTDTHFTFQPTADARVELAAGLREAGGDPAVLGLVAGRSSRDLEGFVAALAAGAEA